MRRLSFFLAAVAACVAAPSAFAADAVPAPRAADAYARTPVSVPASVPVAAPDFTVATSTATAEAILVGGDVRVRYPEPDCGPCRLGYNECGDPKWGGHLWLGGWLWAQTGKVGVNGRNADIDTSLSDSLDLFQEHGDSALTGGGRVDYGRCFLSGWASYIHVSGERDNLVTGEPIEASYKGLTAEIVAGYRVGEISLGCSPCAPCLAFEPYVGTRYNGMEIEIQGANGSVKRTRDWWDPIVGCNFKFDFRNKWFADVQVDVGGFGVSSNFTWSAKADVGYMFTKHFGAFVGVAAIGWDYDDSGFVFDLTQWGPFLGLVVAF